MCFLAESSKNKTKMKCFFVFRVLGSNDRVKKILFSLHILTLWTKTYPKMYSTSIYLLRGGHTRPPSHPRYNGLLIYLALLQWCKYLTGKRFRLRLIYQKLLDKEVCRSLLCKGCGNPLSTPFMHAHGDKRFMIILNRN